ncbi:hypothetical protein MKW92_032931 [Papaver armeniacum]|nr:hypothetical protein MKW92_032931 [Papaver armeniacum]
MMLDRNKSRVVDVAEEDEMSVNINIAELGELTEENKERIQELSLLQGSTLIKLHIYVLRMDRRTFTNRLYFLHGGNGLWLSSWLQMAGFPILVVPLVILYFRRDRSQPNVHFFVCRKLLLYAALLGLFQGIASYMYSYGLSFLPVSTSSLLFTTQLISTSFVSYFWVKQKFTPYSINAIVVIIMGCILLGIRGSVITHLVFTKSQYLRGFFISIASASSVGFILVSAQVAYAKANQVMTYPIVLQFQFCFSFFATVSCTVGSLISKDFLAIQKEASEYDLGAKKYYLVLVSMAVVWQLQFIGRAGVIFCTSSLFAGVVGATILPFSQIAAKGMALGLTLWGFTSYFYGSYTNKTKARIMSITP